MNVTTHAPLPRTETTATGRALKLVYLLKQPLSARDAERFGILSARARGHDVTVLDLHDLIFPEVAVVRADSAPSADVIARRISTWREFAGCRALVADADLVVSIVRSYGMCARSLRVYRMFAETGTPYLALAPLVDPIFADRRLAKPLIKRAFDQIKRFRLQEIGASLLSRIPFKALGLPQARYFVYNGTASRGPNQMVGVGTVTIDTHAHDFDLALRARGEASALRDQAVFLDQDLPFHPDFAAAGHRPLEPTRYLAELNAAFDRIESELGLKVVVAAHPRANAERTRQAYGGRRVVFGETAQTVAESRLVLAHYSRSCNFAVILEKPLMLLVTRQICEWVPWLRGYIDNFSAALGTRPRHYDNPAAFALDDAFAFDRDAYRNFTAKFIKAPGSPERPYWDIVFDRVEADFALAASAAR
jgi:hypothetical protein